MFSPRRTIQLKNGPIGKLRARNVLLSVYAEHASPEIVNEVNEYPAFNPTHNLCCTYRLQKAYGTQRTRAERKNVPRPLPRTKKEKKGTNFKRFPAANVSPTHRLYVDIRMTFLYNSQILFVATSHITQMWEGGDRARSNDVFSRVRNPCQLLYRVMLVACPACCLFWLVHPPFLRMRRRLQKIVRSANSLRATSRRTTRLFRRYVARIRSRDERLGSKTLTCTSSRLCLRP